MYNSHELFQETRYNKSNEQKAKADRQSIDKSSYTEEEMPKHEMQER